MSRTGQMALAVRCHGKLAIPCVESALLVDELPHAGLLEALRPKTSRSPDRGSTVVRMERCIGALGSLSPSVLRHVGGQSLSGPARGSCRADRLVLLYASRELVLVRADRKGQDRDEKDDSDEGTSRYPHLHAGGFIIIIIIIIIMAITITIITSMNITIITIITITTITTMMMMMMIIIIIIITISMIITIITIITITTMMMMIIIIIITITTIMMMMMMIIIIIITIIIKLLQCCRVDALAFCDAWDVATTGKATAALPSAQQQRLGCKMHDRDDDNDGDAVDDDNDGYHHGHCNDEKDDYIAWKISSPTFNVSDEFTPKDKTRYGWRAWTSLWNPAPVDDRNCETTLYGIKEYLETLGNISTCAVDYVENETACVGDSTCMWRPMFQSGVCMLDPKSGILRAHPFAVSSAGFVGVSTEGAVFNVIEVTMPMTVDNATEIINDAGTPVADVALSFNQLRRLAESRQLMVQLIATVATPAHLFMITIFEVKMSSPEAAAETLGYKEVLQDDPEPKVQHQRPMVKEYFKEEDNKKEKVTGKSSSLVPVTTTTTTVLPPAGGKAQDGAKYGA
ncbi:hypothetical protein AK812_SmicGene14202 [Symbiodinium microadriaticum]|uniref:Uncharacterized protein n=1 Tax=Symbiodinium microadriaticum TaxID=2951 RepID=A0A1Q9E648_SYMMI|nr:hypothetical protein AK812_SmicGene14202 [Symbiodinium microadriaticum]